jgi:hypothetical protein
MRISSFSLKRPLVPGVNGNRQLSGYPVAVAGFTLLVINALSYILDWEIKSPALTVIGLIFVILGLRLARGPPS